MSRSSPLLGTLMVLGAATLWGLSATWAQYLQLNGVETLLIVQARVTFSLLLLLPLFAIFRPRILRVRPADWWRFALVGIIGMAGANFTYYYTMKLSSVASAILLQYLAPLAVLGYGIASKEEALSWWKVSAALVSLAGCYLAVGGATGASLPLTPVAVVSGILSMGCFAFLTVYSRHLLARYPIWTVILGGVFFASLFWILVQPPSDLAAQNIAARTWIALGGIALTSVLFPYLLYFGGLRLISSSRAIITSTLEPVVAIGTAAIFLGERLDLWRGAGALLVLSAIIAVQVGNGKITDAT